MNYGLIGEKLGHSYSKIIHEKLGAYDFDLIPLERNQVADFIRAGDFKGLTVTIPYKQTVMAFCDEISDLARNIGAVNTLYFDEAHRLCGTNTDYHGFLYATAQAGLTFLGKSVLIVGDGATHKTIRHAVLNSGAKEIFIASRKVSEPLLERLVPSVPNKVLPPINCTTVNYADKSIFSHAEIVINATPVGMWPNTEACPVHLSEFPNCCGAFDVIYNPYYTKFLQEARALGIPHTGGLAMLVAQATAAAKLFVGKDFEGENLHIIDELKEQFA